MLTLPPGHAPHFPAQPRACFDDRQDAGRKLSEALSAWKGQDDLTVIGIPRGGVVVAAEVARALEARLEVWVARKLRVPSHPALALGSVGEDGEMIVHEEMLRRFRIPATYLVEEVRTQRREVARGAELYRTEKEGHWLRDRRVLLVDDGLATGSTVLAALRGIRRHRPSSIMIAAPVAPSGVEQDLKADSSALKTLVQSIGFGEIGQYYLRFREVSDDEVLASLAA